MHAHLAIGATLLSQGLAAIVVASPSVSTSPALITPGPQIELLRKQNNDRFMGYVQIGSGAWTSQQCASGNTFYQTGDYWACCATTRAGCVNIPIGCVSGSMIYRVTATPGGLSLTNTLSTRACTQIWTSEEDKSYTVCNTGFMFENMQDSSPRTQIFCGIEPLNFSYYRQQPPTTTSTSKSPAATPLQTPVNTTPIVTPSPDSPTPVPESGTKSKAWIAGAVVGPLVGLALIGLGIFFFMRRKKNKTQTAPAIGSVGPAPTAYQQNTYGSSGPNSPPQYYPPPMQQNAGAPGFIPVGVAKQDNYYPPQPQSPVTQGSQSPNPQSPYGAQPQSWQQGQPVYGAPSPSMSPQPQNVLPAQYVAGESRPFSSELEGSHGHGQPEVLSVQPKTH